MRSLPEPARTATGIAAAVTAAALTAGIGVWLAVTAPEATSAAVQAAVSTPVPAPSPAQAWTSLRNLVAGKGIRPAGNEEDPHLRPRPNGDTYDKHRGHHGPSRTDSDGRGDQPRWTVRPRAGGDGWTVCRPQASWC